MEHRAKSPKIRSISWGQIEVDDGQQTRRFKDAKLWPGGCRGWDWNETGTSHVPGIQPDDVRELVDNGAERVILSRGMNRRLRVKDETLSWLRDKGVDVLVLQTDDAVDQYNRLAETEPVGALIHSTC